MQPPLLYLIELRSKEKLPGLTSTFHPKYWYLAVWVMMDATEEIFFLPSNTCMITTSLMKPAHHTSQEVMTMDTNAPTQLFARTVTLRTLVSFLTLIMSTM